MKATAWLLAANAGSAASVALTTVLLARALGPTDRGLVTAATTPLMLLVALMSGGVPDALTHYVARVPSYRRPVFMRAAALILMGSLIGIVVIVVSAGSLTGAHTEIKTQMMLLSLSIIPAAVMFLLRAQALAFLQWRRVAAEALISAAFKIIAVVALTAIGLLSVTSASIVLAVGSSIGILAYISMRGKSEPSYRGRRDEVAPNLRTLARYSAATWLGVVAGSAISFVDQLALTPMASAYEAGIYAVAINVSNLVALVSNSVRQVVIATESSGVQLERIAATGRATLLLNLPIAAVTCAATPWLIPVLFGSAFRGAVIPTIVLVLPLILISTGSIASAGLMALGRPGSRSTAIAAGALMNALLVLALVPRWGALGAAIAMLANLVPSCVCIYVMKKDCGIPIRDFLVPRKSDCRQLLSALGSMCHR